MTALFAITPTTNLHTPWDWLLAILSIGITRLIYRVERRYASWRIVED